MHNKKRELNTFRCGRLLATHTVKWKHNLVLSISQITSNYELIWYGKPNANKPFNHEYQQDESTARRHLKSPWSLSGSSLHPTKRSRSWSWMTPDCSFSIDPPIPEIGLFQNLTLKIQGQGHSQGQTRWLHLLLRIQSKRLLYISWHLDHIWLRTWGMANFIFDRENFRSRPWPRSNLIVSFKA